MNKRMGSIISTSVTLTMVAASVYILNDITTNYEARECVPVFVTHPLLFICATGILICVFTLALTYFVSIYDRG